MVSVSFFIALSSVSGSFNVGSVYPQLTPHVKTFIILSVMSINFDLSSVLLFSSVLFLSSSLSLSSFSCHGASLLSAICSAITRVLLSSAAFCSSWNRVAVSSTALVFVSAMALAASKFRLAPASLASF